MDTADICRGALFSWLIFLDLTGIVAIVFLHVYAWPAMVVAAIVSLCGTCFGALLARIVSRRLEMVQPIALHLVAYAALGLVFGAFASVIFLGPVWGGSSLVLPLALVPTVASTIAVPLGWRCAVAPVLGARVSART